MYKGQPYQRKNEGDPEPHEQIVNCMKIVETAFDSCVI